MTGINSYRTIRNKIRTLSYESLVDAILHVMTVNSKIKSFPYWHYLLLLRWSMEFAGEKHPSKDATLGDVDKLVRSVQELEGNHHIFFNVGHKTFIIMANQQIRYQEIAWSDSFARQWLLFSKLKSQYDIGTAFYKLAGLTIGNVLLWLKVLFMAKFISEITGGNELPLTDNEIIAGMARGFKPDVFVNLLKLFSIDRAIIRDFVTSDLRLIKNYDLQVFEISMFSKKPLFLYKGIYIIPDKRLLNVTIADFIYDFMKNRDDRFSTELGKRMEKYMQLGLEEISIPFMDENQVRKKFGEKESVVDFIIQDSVLVEAKAIELRPYTSINPTDELLGLELSKRCEGICDSNAFHRKKNEGCQTTVWNRRNIQESVLGKF